MKLFIVLAFITSVASSAKYAKIIEEQFKDFANEPNIHLITDEDNAPPTVFNGNVMQAKVTKLNINKDGGNRKYNYNFETQNGISIASIGKLKDEKTFVVSGSYAYTGADGKKYRVRYTADEFGYHPAPAELDDEPIEPVVVPKIASDRRGRKYNINNSQFIEGYGNSQNGFSNSAYQNQLHTDLVEPVRDRSYANVAINEAPSNGFYQQPHRNRYFGLSQTSENFGNSLSDTLQAPHLSSYQSNDGSSLTSLFGGDESSSRFYSNQFNRLTFPSTTESASINSRTYLPPKSYLPPQRTDFQ